MWYYHVSYQRDIHYILNLQGARNIIFKLSQSMFFFNLPSSSIQECHRCSFYCILLRFSKYDSFTCDLITTTIKKMRQGQQYNVTYIFKKTFSIMYNNVDFAGNTKNLTKNEYFYCHHR